LRQIAPDPDDGLPQGAKERLVGVAEIVHVKLRLEASFAVEVEFYAR
jgi:hypothetical protein